MVKKGLLFVFAFSVLLMVSLGFASAAPNITAITYDEPDLFYSNYAGNNVIHVNITVQNSSALVVLYANFTNITTSCGTGGIVNFTDTGSNVFNASCDISGVAGALPSGTVLGGSLTFAAVQLGDPNPAINSTGMGNSPLLHNLGSPVMNGTQYPETCIRFGSDTVNFTKVLNFASINFVMDVEMNISCMSQGMVNLPIFQDGNLINISGIDMSTQEKAQRLGQLPQAIQIRITPPHQFGDSRVYIDSTFFTELNTNATIKFYNLPFTSRPNIVNDTGAAGVNSTTINWTSNGFNSAMGISTGNLTFVVYGFSGYNITDNVNPLVTINSPPASQNITVSNFSVSVNGTGTEPSFISITLNGINYTYNGTTGAGSANCTNISADREVFNCYSAVPQLTHGTYSVNVTAYDYGGTVGNSNITSRSITVDTAAPAINVYSPVSNGTYYANQTILIQFSMADLTLSRLWYMNDSGNSTTQSGAGLFTASINFTSNGTHTFRFYGNDSFNNLGTAVIAFNVASSLPGNTTLITNQTSVNINETMTQLIVAYNSSLQNVTINSTFSNQSVLLNLSQILSSGNVTIPNNFTLIRESATGINYTAVIPANTNISGGSSWSGEIFMPIVNVSSFTAPSGSTNVTIDVGTSVELNFSSPVRIIIGRMAGTKAAWSRGSATLIAISTVCNNMTLPTNIDAVTTRECYGDSGSDLVIWTYHFTSFAAYTPSTITPPAGTTDPGGGLCHTNWTCTSWSSCVNESQTRTCAKVLGYCFAGDKPAESQSCAAAACAENWECVAWGECVNGNQTRSCVDLNSCGTSASKPVLEQTCTVSSKGPLEGIKKLATSKTMIIIAIVAGLAIIAVIILQLLPKKKK